MLFPLISFVGHFLARKCKNVFMKIQNRKVNTFRIIFFAWVWNPKKMCIFYHILRAISNLTFLAPPSFRSFRFFLRRSTLTFWKVSADLRKKKKLRLYSSLARRFGSYLTATVENSKIWILFDNMPELHNIWSYLAQRAKMLVSFKKNDLHVARGKPILVAEGCHRGLR